MNKSKKKEEIATCKAAGRACSQKSLTLSVSIDTIGIDIFRLIFRNTLGLKQKKLKI